MYFISWEYFHLLLFKCFQKTISDVSFQLDFGTFFSYDYSKTVVNAFGKVFLFIFIQAFLENNFCFQFFSRFWIFFSIILGKVFSFIFVQVFSENKWFWIFFLFVTTINPFGKWCCDFLIYFDLFLVWPWAFLNLKN